MMKKVLMLIAVLSIASGAMALPAEVGHWPLDGDLTDVSGNGYDGTLGGTATFAAAQFGDGLDTSVGYVTLPVEAWNDNMADAEGFTVCFWGYTTVSNHKSVSVRVLNNDTALRMLNVHTPWSTTAYFDVADPDMDDSTVTKTYQRVLFNDSSLWASQWTHWTFVYTPGQQQLYVNGTVIAEGTGTLWDNPIEVGATAFSFGAEDTGVNPFQGIMDDVRLYSTALTAEDIQAVMAGEVGASRAGAHTPSPTGDLIDHTVLDPANPGSLSWQEPIPYSAADPNSEPNLLSVDQYDITYYIIDTENVSDDDPNWVRPEQTYYGGTGITSPYAIAADDAADTDGDIFFSQTMFWHVDTTVVWDSNEMLDEGTYTVNSNGTYTQLVVGNNWQFSTVPEYLAPELDSFDNIITTLDILPVTLSATISGNSDPMNAPVFTLLTDDIDYPGGNPVLTDTSVADVDPELGYINPTATLTTDTAGTYKVKLEINDGTTYLEDIAEVVVYADACQAAQDAPSGWTAHQFDFDGNCYVDLSDFAVFATEWLNDTTMQVQETDGYIIDYVPQTVFDARIEAESADPNDPNACSDGPLNLDINGVYDPEGTYTGIRIQDQGNASGGQALGYASDTAWVEYTVDVQTEGVPVDIYAGHALSGTGTVTLSFGTKVTSDIYGTCTFNGTSGWTNFTSGRKIGAVTFDTVGPQTVRVSFGGSLNLDWFSFDW